ncbi:hypothetical protein EDD18DRAFT_1356096 [Armillaria luteobubalina]|uniref:Uncharacterized protein n=1 Tax=Armillaria luteobubalina TaxID=153913 RepID=A0AA39Q116_9AGAR|nr:hypothetical protein EDD18DRAFT_1356096 [Armillaria luteobubalina]
MSQRTTNLKNGTPSLEEVEDPGICEDETIDKVGYEESDGLEDDGCDKTTVWKEDGCTETISMIKVSLTVAPEERAMYTNVVPLDGLVSQ